jgi:HD-like signal output (HDOD) protein
MALHEHLSQLDLERSLPSPPAVALDVLRICNDPDGEIAELAEVLSRDPVLTGQLLQVANSAFYFRGAPVTSLHRASMVLGMQALKIVALGFTLANEMPRRGSAAGLDLPAYWHRSLLNAVMARALARSLEKQVAEEAFLCGLLAEIGKLVLAHGLPEVYAPVVEEGGGWPADALERERLGFVSSEAGEILLRSWSVPELLVLGSAFANRREHLPADSPYLARRLADIVALARLGTSDIFGDAWDASTPPFATEAQSRFGLSQTDVEQVVADLDDECFEAAEMLAIGLPQGVSYHALLEQARDQVVPLTVDALMQLDRTPPIVVPADWSA